MKLLVLIVDRGLGEKIDILSKANYQIVCLGKGTADSEILNLIGLGETEKDVVISLVDNEQLEEIFAELKQRNEFNIHGGGVAFTIPISSISKSTLELINLLSENMEVQDE